MPPKSTNPAAEPPMLCQFPTLRGFPCRYMVSFADKDYEDFVFHFRQEHVPSDLDNEQGIKDAFYGLTVALVSDALEESDAKDKVTLERPRITDFADQLMIHYLAAGHLITEASLIIQVLFEHFARNNMDAANAIVHARLLGQVLVTEIKNKFGIAVVVRLAETIEEVCQLPRLDEGGETAIMMRAFKDTVVGTLKRYGD